MAKRDPNKSARNRIIASIKEQLRDIVDEVLEDVGLSDEASLNATIGSKNDEFFDLKQDVIHSHDEFVLRWMKGLRDSARTGHSPAHQWMYTNLQRSRSFRKYVSLFLKRSYLKHFDELSKARPSSEDSAIWIGQERANYGLLITPRFVNEQWENDKSEIRAFRPAYWTVGHVMETGLVIPGKEKIFEFSNIEQYLLFFTDTLVRNSGSPHEYDLATQYADFVIDAENPEAVPLLIPEFRYGGIAQKHLYRLDFLIINPYTLDKIGFELSPWSTHGYLQRTKQLTQKQINDLAKDNFQREMRRHRAFFKEHGIYTLIYTDESLANTKKLFREDIYPHLLPEKPQEQLSFEIIEELLQD